MPVALRAVYPGGFLDKTAGYEGQRVGYAGGLTQFGVNRAVLPPPSRTALRHWHEIEDEFVIVVSGEAVLREEDGKNLLRAGNCASFKAGVANGHAFENRSDAEVLLFEIGTRTQNETVHYLDVDLRFERRDGVRHFVYRNGMPCD